LRKGSGSRGEDKPHQESVGFPEILCSGVAIGCLGRLHFFSLSRLNPQNWIHLIARPSAPYNNLTSTSSTFWWDKDDYG